MLGWCCCWCSTLWGRQVSPTSSGERLATKSSPPDFTHYIGCLSLSAHLQSKPSQPWVSFLPVNSAHLDQCRLIISQDSLLFLFCVGIWSKTNIPTNTQLKIKVVPANQEKPRSWTHIWKKYYEISLVSCMKSSALSTRCPRKDSCRPEWDLLRLYWTMHLAPGWEVPDYHGALSHTLFHNLWVNSLRRPPLEGAKLGPYSQIIWLSAFADEGLFSSFWVLLGPFWSFEWLWGAQLFKCTNMVFCIAHCLKFFCHNFFYCDIKLNIQNSKTGVKTGNHIPLITKDPGSDNKSKYNPGLPNKL